MNTSKLENFLNEISDNISESNNEKLKNYGIVGKITPPKSEGNYGLLKN